MKVMLGDAPVKGDACFICSLPIDPDLDRTVELRWKFQAPRSPNSDESPGMVSALCLTCAKAGRDWIARNLESLINAMQREAEHLKAMASYLEDERAMGLDFDQEAIEYVSHREDAGG